MVTNNLRFPEQYEDAEMGLHYNNLWMEKKMLTKNSIFVITISLLVLLGGCKMEYIGDEITVPLVQRLLPEFSPIFPPETEFLYLRELLSGTMYIGLLKGKSPYHNIAEIYQSFGFAEGDFSNTHNYAKLAGNIPPHWDPLSLEHFQSAILKTGTKDGKAVFLAFTYEDEQSLDSIRFYIEYDVILD